MTRPSPHFSIVIPTRGRPRQLARCLEGISRLRWPRDEFEVIVVEDGRSGASDALEPYRDGLPVELIEQEHSGPAVARNRGAWRARGRHLAFLDDDCWPAPDWLERLAQACASWRGQPVMVGGRTENALPENPYSAASEAIVQYLAATRLPDGGRFFPSNNLAVSADGFRRIGGFSDRYRMAGGEDRDFCRRWQDRGHAVLEAPEALVHHAHSLTLGAFLRQHFHYGCGAAVFHRTARAVPRRGVLPAPGAFYVKLLRYPFERQSRQPSRQTALLLLSQVSTATGFVRETLRRTIPPTGSTDRI